MVVVTERTWECACGEFKVKLAGEAVLNLCCHCHSCVAPCRFIDDKRAAGEGISASKDGGIAVSLYKSSKIEFPNDLDGKLSFVKVGETGGAHRCYTNCCRSQVTNVVSPKFAGLTTNMMKNGDGSPYVPPGPLLNMNAVHAFDPGAVPEPKHDRAPLGAFLAFLFKTKLNPFEPSLKIKYPALFPSPSHVEIVPITW